MNVSTTRHVALVQLTLSLQHAIIELSSLSWRLYGFWRARCFISRQIITGYLAWVIVSGGQSVNVDWYPRWSIKRGNAC